MPELRNPSLVCPATVLRNPISAACSRDRILWSLPKAHDQKWGQERRLSLALILSSPIIKAEEYSWSDSDILVSSSTFWVLVTGRLLLKCLTLLLCAFAWYFFTVQLTYSFCIAPGWCMCCNKPHSRKYWFNFIILSICPIPYNYLVTSTFIMLNGPPIPTGLTRKVSSVLSLPDSNCLFFNKVSWWSWVPLSSLARSLSHIQEFFSIWFLYHVVDTVSSKGLPPKKLQKHLFSYCFLWLPSWLGTYSFWHSWCSINICF